MFYRSYQASNVILDIGQWSRRGIMLTPKFVSLIRTLYMSLKYARSYSILLPHCFMSNYLLTEDIATSLTASSELLSVIVKWGDDLRQEVLCSQLLNEFKVSFVHSHWESKRLTRFI